MVGAASGPHAPRGEPGAALLYARGKESTQEGTHQSDALAAARYGPRAGARGERRCGPRQRHFLAWRTCPKARRSGGGRLSRPIRWTDPRPGITPPEEGRGDALSTRPIEDARHAPGRCHRGRGPISRSGDRGTVPRWLLVAQWAPSVGGRSTPRDALGYRPLGPRRKARLPHPGVEYGEGAQPSRPQPRGDSHGPPAG